MARYVSLRHKSLIILLGCVVLLGALSVSFWQTLLSNQSSYYQSIQRQRAVQQVELFKELRHEYLTVAFESYSNIRRGDRTDLNYLANQLNEQYEELTFNFNITGVWLFNADRQPLYASADVYPPAIEHILTTTLEQEYPVTQIDCYSQGCNQYSSIPLLSEQQKTSAIIIQSDMVGIIGWLKRSLKTEVGLVKLPSSIDTTMPLKAVRLLSMTEQSLTTELLHSLPNTTTSYLALRDGVSMKYNDAHYLISLIPLQGENAEYCILLVNDETAVIQRLKREQQLLFASSLALFLLIISATYWGVKNTSQRLLQIADRLPLLSDKRFEEFRETKQPLSSHVIDELDILSESADQLGYELEALSHQVEQRTQELENIAMYDLLTGLPNRNMLHYQLRKSLLGLHRANEHLAVLFLDLDDFKKVNDSHGHKMGDLLLQEAAQRINRTLRESDTVCRFGGDEFVIVLPYIEQEVHAETVAKKVIHSFKQPVIIENLRFYVSPSIGIAFASDSNITSDDIIRQADIAMYEAKQAGGCGYKLYDSAMYHRISEKVLLEADVRQALSKGEFSLALQPQIETKTSKLTGFEALLRWVHPERGPVPPDAFIPILEGSEHMIELGYWVISHSCDLLKMMERAGYEGVKIAVNLSATQFLDPGLIPILMRHITSRNIAPEQIELELTESTLVEDIDQTLRVMNQLREQGFTCAIDDYGTGYSSLSYLKKMPVDIIKVDKSFVSGMLENQADLEIVESTIAMVHRMGMIVVAEGVETKEQLEHLRSVGCDMLQGYLFSPPIPEARLISQLEEHIKQGHWPLPDDSDNGAKAS